MKKLFKLDINDHDTLLGGWMGVSHGLIALVSSLLVWWLTDNDRVTAWFACWVAIYYFYKENLIGLKFKTFPSWRGLDSFMDWVLPVINGIGWYIK